MGAGSERCPACGASWPAGARFCGRCGRRHDDGPTVVDLAPLAAPAGGAVPGEQRAIVATRPPDRRRAAAVLGAVLVLGLAAFGLTRLLDDDGGDPAAAPEATTTTAAPEDEAPDATTTTVAPTTSAPATTSTVAPATTTSIPYVNQRRGPVLDDAQQGRSLFIANVNTLVRIDLGTGLVTSRTGLGGILNGPLWWAGDRLLVLGNPVRVLPGDLAGPVEERTLPAGFGAWSPDGADPSGFWAIDYPESATDPIGVRRYDRAGALVGERRLPAGLSLVGFAADRAVLARAGRIWTMGPDERLVPYAVGAVATVQHGWVLWLGCDDRGGCTYHLGDATRPDTGRTSLEATFLYAYSGGEGGGLARALSPDGATVIAPVANTRDGLPRIVDLATGSVLETAAQGSPYFAWSPDGSWLVEVNGALVVATNVRTGARRTLAVPGWNGASLTGVAFG